MKTYEMAEKDKTREDSVQIMEVDSENQPSTSKSISSSQHTEGKKPQQNLPWYDEFLFMRAYKYLV
jgi:hypothetical protein